MKQTILMMLLLVGGTAGPVISGPFVGVVIYYLFAVLRPQSLWEWALVVNLSWSFYVGLATIISTALYFPRLATGKRFTAAHSAMIAFAVWITLSNFSALNREVSSFWYWEYLKIFAMFFCSSLVIGEFSQVRTLYMVALFSLGYIAYEMNILYFIDHRLDIYFVGFGGLDNNGAGLMVAMGVPMAYFMWQAYNQWWRWGFLGMLLLMHHPVLGVGLRNSDMLSARYGADVAGRTIHSQYFQILADSGFPALTFYIMTLFATWRALRRTQKNCRNASSETDQLAYNMASGIEGAIAVFC